MLFNKSKDVPKEVAAVKLDKWYATLDDQNHVKLNRYLKDADTSSKYAFFLSVITASNADENWKFTSYIGESAIESTKSDYEKFTITNLVINALTYANFNEEAKELCKQNLDIYPSVAKEVCAENNGKPPLSLPCRNRLIDILIGVDANYEEANEMLDLFRSLDLIDDEELALRKQSLKIHRMQRTFDSMFTLEPKKE